MNAQNLAGLLIALYFPLTIITYHLFKYLFDWRIDDEFDEMEALCRLMVIVGVTLLGIFLLYAKL